MKHPEMKYYKVTAVMETDLTVTVLAASPEQAEELGQQAAETGLMVEDGAGDFRITGIEEVTP